MKHHFFLMPFLALWGMSGLLAAQEPIRSDFNMFRANDTIVKQQVEYKNPGKTGENVFWNFGKLKAVNEKYTVVYSRVADSTATIAGTEHQTRYYYELRNDSLLLTGYENPTTKITHRSPELLLRFPIKPGDNFEGHYQGNGTYCDKLDINAYGSTRSVADASGTIILPGGDTLRHVIRVHTTKLISEKIGLVQPDTGTSLPGDSLKQAVLSADTVNHYLQTDSTVLKIDAYRWYAAGYRYPVFETILTGSATANPEDPYFATAFFYAPEGHAYLKSDEKNTALQAELLEKGKQQTNTTDNPENNVEDNMGFTYKYYPNPVQAHLYLEYDLSRDAKVSFGLYGITGLMVYRSPVKSLRTGTYSETIDMGYYPRGEYILTILVNNKPFSEKILKK